MITVFVNGKKQKIKMKKNALDPVDIEEEKKKDPKYKTELCKSYMETGICLYGNRCRFAHGEKELAEKTGGENYKKKPCKAFFENGYCPYGSRCSYKHDERKVKDLNMPYFFINIFILNKIIPGRRLKVFQEICKVNSNITNYSSDSTYSTEENNFYYIKNNSSSSKNYPTQSLYYPSIPNQSFPY